jgi:hypothetical protein
VGSIPAEGAKVMESYMELLLGIIIGAVIGWNFLPQPQWVKDLLARIIG